MGFYLIKSPLALAVGEAVRAIGEVVELADEDAQSLVANGTVEPAEAAAAATASAETAAATEAAAEASDEAAPRPRRRS